MMAGARSVQWRILVRLLPLLALTFVVFLLWLGGHLSEVLRAANLASARSSNQSVIAAVRATMVTDGSHGVWGRIAEEIPRHDETEIEIINTRGRVLYSADPTEARTIRGLSDSPCSACHENGSVQPTSDNAVLHDSGRGSYQIVAAPLRNGESCRVCHDQDGRSLGVVLVRRSLLPVQRQVWTAQLALTVLGGVVLLSTVLTTRRQVDRHLDRPLGGLVAGAKAIAAGDLQHRVEQPEHVELAALANSLNASAARQSKLQRELLENERLAAVGQTVAGLSHTLKNVLNGLRAGRFILDRALKTGDKEKFRKGLRVTRSSVRHVERLIYDMLHYAKQRDPKREPIDPNAVIHEVIDELKELARGWGVKLRAETDEGIGEIALDRTDIYRALVDLVTNAIEACTESESGDLVILRSRAAPDEIVLSVEDNGIGMTEEVLSKLYTRFFSTKATGGTGLGMLVVKRIVEEHKGTIEVDSAPGRGTVFDIHLPISTEAAAGPS
jgi:signal transduction histidine kinase